MPRDPNDIYEEIYDRYGENTEYLLNMLESEYGEPHKQVITHLQEQEEIDQIFATLDAYKAELQEQKNYVNSLRITQRRLELLLLSISIIATFFALSTLRVSNVIISDLSTILMLGLASIFSIVISLFHVKQAIKKYMFVKDGFPR